MKRGGTDQEERGIVQNEQKNREELFGKTGSISNCSDRMKE